MPGTRYLIMSLVCLLIVQHTHASTSTLASDTVDILELLTTARETIDRGDFEQALKLAQEVHKLSHAHSYPRGEAEAFNVSGQVHIRSAQYDSAIWYFQHALEVYDSLHDKSGIASAHLYIGQSYDYLGLYTSALQHLDKALHYVHAASDTILYVKICNSIGVTNFNFGNYETALRSYGDALYLLSSRRDPVSNKHYAGLLNNIGAVYQEMQQYDKAIEHFEKLHITALKLKHKYLTAVSLLNLGEVHRLKGNYRQSLDYLKQSLDHYKTLHDQRGMALVYSNMGDVYKRLHNTAESERSYLQAREAGELTHNKDVLIRPMLGLSDLYLQAGQFSQSAALLKLSRELAEEMQSRPSLEQVYLTQSRLDSARGDYQQAYYWHKQYASLKDDLFNERNTKRIIQMQQLYENARKEKEIIQLNEAHEIERIRNDSDKNLLKSLIALTIVVIIFLASSAYLKSRHASQLKDERDKVNTMNTELNDLVRKIERQRKKLAAKNDKLEELSRENNGLIGIVAHDLRSPLNSITGITNLLPLLGTINPEQSDLLKRIGKLCDSSNTLIADLLELSHSEFTSDITVTKFDAEMFVRELIENYHEQASRKSLQLIGQFNLHEPVTLDTDQLYLTRILDNIVTNAIKFSPADKIITITVQSLPDNKIEFMIQDEGPGFAREDLPHLFKKFKKLSARPTGGEHSTGLGLSIVKVLVEKLEGTIDVKNAIPTGACITITLPTTLQQEEQPQPMTVNAMAS